MPLPRNLNAYKDVKAVLDAAMDNLPAAYMLATPNAAIRWRQEAYYFRKLSQLGEDHRYDNLMFKVDGRKVLIENRSVVGVLTREDGKKIEVEPAESLSEAEEFARNFAKQRLGLETDGDEE